MLDSQPHPPCLVVPAAATPVSRLLSSSTRLEALGVAEGAVVSESLRWPARIEVTAPKPLGMCC